MMKKPALFGFVVVSGIFGLVFFLRQSLTLPTALQTPSQMDTQIDDASSYDLINYFISTLGESSLAEVEQRTLQYAQQKEGMTVDDALLEQFILYKQALASLDFAWESSKLELLTLEQIHQRLLMLQSQFFTLEQQQLLFANDNALRELAINKLRIKNQAIDQQDAKQQWQVLLSKQAQYIQRSEYNARLIPALNKNDERSPQAQYLERVELVGEEGAQRLAELDQQRERFSEQLAIYLQQRESVLNEQALTDDEKKQYIAQLRSETFDVKQLKRVEALERMQDHTL
ncbi:lipase secretion chaperone [Vibrio aestuarianus]|uniref:lipase secretion chaperone n=1 Tax=Vibrio aestuarianus TaxID=28171 RepID=UPI0021C2FCDD|nr:lipase secretion chaperone [Vibrio aestuarianus]MDE1230097.1 lipase chaperone [Vibrio aestuarianus]CAH8239947.1 Lipase chaperone [Vibrio aestuarianus]